MRRVLKWVGVVVVAGLVGIAAVFAVAWAVTGNAMTRTFAVNDPAPKVVRDADALALGHHLYDTRGCSDCHGPTGEGKVLIDEPGLIHLVPSNLPRALQNHAYTDKAIAAAIRHGVRPDGTPLVIMPAGDYAELDDRDVAALITYLRSLPDSDNDPGTTAVGPIGRVLYMAGKLPLFPAEAVNHAPRARRAPPAAITPAYGQYIAQSCTGCHGVDFTGGLVVEPGKPASANLTPHASGLAGWTEDDFLRVMHTGRRPDGRRLDPLMPWATYSRMQEVELRALWTYLSSLEPAPAPGTAGSP